MLTLIIILTAVGIVMIAMEVILPGGVLGVGGALCIVAAVMVTAFSQADDVAALGAGGRFALGSAIVVGSTAVLLLWLKYFTRAGFVSKNLLDTSIGGTDTYAAYQQLLEKTGVAVTDLRPSGKARFDGKKCDVLAEGGMIPSGTEVKVVKVEGSKVVVRAMTS